MKALAGIKKLTLEQRYDAADKPLERHVDRGVKQSLPESLAQQVWLGKSGVNDFIVYGPYSKLPPGKYVLAVRLQLVEGGRDKIAGFGLASKTITVAERIIRADETPVGQWRVFAFSVDIKEELPSVEYRVWQNGRAVALDRIYLFKVE